MSIADTKAQIAVEIAPDRLTAYVQQRGGGAPAELKKDEIVNALIDAEIVINEDTLRRVEEYLAACAAGGGPPERTVIAQGQPPVEPRDAEFVWGERFQREALAWQDDAPINYYKQENIVLVGEGEEIGTLRPPTPGKPGVDIRGQAAPPTRQPAEVELDESVALSEADPTVVIAKAAGRVEFSGRRLRVISVVDIPQDVDFESGSIDAPVDVHIRGGVQQGFEVKSAGSIVIGGTIERAVVVAQTNVHVRGGIVGGENGAVRAGGEIVAKFCNAAELHAGGDVSVHAEAIASQIRTNGRFIAAHGAVVGGRLYARAGVEAANLGTEAGVPTVVTIGVDPVTCAEHARLGREIETREQKLAKIRERLRPFLANKHDLTPSQRERATELLFDVMAQADAMEESITKLKKRRDKLFAGVDAGHAPAVVVGKCIHAGVTIEIEGLGTEFRSSVRGPVRIEKRLVENAVELVAVDQSSGSQTVLPSSSVDGDGNEGAAPTGQ